MFKVPRNHPEIERLEGRYKKYVVWSSVLFLADSRESSRLCINSYNSYVSKAVYFYDYVWLWCSQGGVHKGLLAELSNGALALVVECDDDAVTLDTNNMMAGKSLLFEIELVALEKQTLG